jgi:Uncharacterized protein conserved in bacteria (DUF2188)
VDAYDDRDTAMSEGRELAQALKVEHIIGRMDGTIGERSSSAMTLTTSRDSR